MRRLSNVAPWSFVVLLSAAAPAWALPTSTELVGPSLEDVLTASTADDADDADDEQGDAVETATVAQVSTSTGPRYTTDLDEATLRRLWTGPREALGSISMGANDFGRVVNGVPFPEDPRWVVVDPPNTYGTEETVAYLRLVLEDMARRYPSAPLMRVNHISAPKGGYLRPHRSHQLGRDVDLGLYYADAADARSRGRTLDLALNWALLKSVLINTDVEVVLLDRRIIKALRQHAEAAGEDREWLDSIFGVTARALVQHAPRHRDHFHVRFYNARAQELGWRVQPLLTADETVPQVIRHRIRPGDSLGRIAQRYGVSITQLKRANGMRNNFLRAGRSLAVPVRGMACERCPAMARVVVPPRRLPRELAGAQPMLAKGGAPAAGLVLPPALASAEVLPSMVLSAPAVAPAASPVAQVGPSEVAAASATLVSMNVAPSSTGSAEPTSEPAASVAAAAVSADVAAPAPSEAETASPAEAAAPSEAVAPSEARESRARRGLMPAME